MSEQAPVYLCFTSWVQMRQFAMGRRLPPSDVFLASGDHERWVAACARRIVLVRSTYVPTLDRDVERWRHIAEVARLRNHENDFETEVIHV